MGTIQTREMKILLGITLGLSIGVVAAEAADDCPTAQSGTGGFVVERGPRSKTEVFHVGKTDVRTIYRYNGEAMLEVTQFQGLFDLERIDRGKRSIFRPVSDLSKNFPLVAGKTLTAKFEMIEGEQKTTRTVALTIKKTEALYIGPCRYNVLRIDLSRSSGSGPLVFIETQYYSPELKLIIAKEYKEDGGGTTLNKYDRIYPIVR